MSLATSRVRCVRCFACVKPCVACVTYLYVARVNCVRLENAL